MFFPKYNQEPNTHTSVSFCLRGQTKYFGSRCTSLHTAISLHCLAFPEKVQLWNLSHMQVVYSLLSWQLLYVLPSYVRATFRKTVKPQDKFSKLITGNWCENSPCPTAVTQCAFTGWTLKVYHRFAPGAFSNSDFFAIFWTRWGNRGAK